MNLTNTLDLILAVARTRGCAPPARIVMRAATVDRICLEDGHRRNLDGCGIPIEVDDTIAAFPGFQIVREVW